MSETQEKIEFSHHLAIWLASLESRIVASREFKIRLPIQDEDYRWKSYQSKHYPDREETAEQLLQHVLDTEKNIDPNSIRVFTAPKDLNSAEYVNHVHFRYTTAKRRECTFTAIGAVEFSHDYDIPSLRLFKLLAGSTGSNIWNNNEPTWFYAATIGDRVSAIKEDSVESAIKLCQQRVKRKVMKDMGVTK